MEALSVCMTPVAASHGVHGLNRGCQERPTVQVCSTKFLKGYNRGTVFSPSALLDWNVSLNGSS